MSRIITTGKQMVTKKKWPSLAGTGAVSIVNNTHAPLRSSATLLRTKVHFNA